MAAWEDEMKNLPRDWVVLDPAAYYASVGGKFIKMDDHSLLGAGSVPPFSAYTVTAKTDLTNITGFRLEAIADPNLPFNGPGRAANGNFVLTEFEVAAAPYAGGKTNAVPLQHATADYSQNGFSVTDAIATNVNKKGGWSVDDLPGRRNVSHQAVFEARNPVGFAGGTWLTFKMTQTYGGEHCLGRFRLSATTGKQPLHADPLSRHARELLSVPPEKRTQAQERELFGFYRLTDSRFNEGNKKIDEEQAKWPTAPTTLVLKARDEPRETHIFKRGDWQKPGPLVTPGVPSILNPLPKDAPLNRLTLAQWLVDRKSPTRGARHRQSHLAGVFRAGHRGDGGRFRHPGRSAHASAIAGLAGGGIHGFGLGCQTYSAADRRIGHLPAILGHHAAVVGEGPIQRVAGPRSAGAGRGGNYT